MYDVAIIGSGIIGLACARALARSGRSVAVFDPEPTRAAARVAAGMLSPWSEHPDDAVSLELRERSLSLYPAWIAAIEKETRVRPDWAICGTLNLDDAEGSVRERLREIMDRSPGSRAVGPAEIQEIAPGVSDDFARRGGIHVPAEGYVDPQTLLDALRQSSAYGIDFMGEAVLGVAAAEGRVRGVVASSGEIEARHVVNATGAWASLAAPPAAPLPGKEVRPVRGEVVVLRPPGRDSPVLGCVIRAGRTYIVPRRDGSVVVGGTAADAGFDVRPTAGGVGQILRGALAVVPALRDWVVQEIRAGLRPFLDGGPWIGIDPERDGLVHAIGMNRHGILLAPAVAERVLQEIEG